MSISIIKPQNPRNHVPKFQTKLGVAEEEPDGPLQGFVDSVNTKAAVYNPAHERPAACYYDRAASGFIWLWL